MPGAVVAPLLTFGHGTASRDVIVDLLRGAGVESVVDVRRIPGSRRHPHVAREELESGLPAAGITYRWEPRLGGRRGADPHEEGVDPWWQVDAFRAYAAHTRTTEFGEALRLLLGGATGARTTVMCSETLWWRCHRRLIADVVVLRHERPVLHLGHDGRSPHTARPPGRGSPTGVWCTTATPVGAVNRTVECGPGAAAPTRVSLGRRDDAG